MAHDVFISYSTEDKPTADAVCATLEAKGIRCWIAPRDVLPGTFWAESIIRAMDRSRLMVLVFSAHANASRQVVHEVERAASKDLPILPLRIDNVVPGKSMEYFLGSPHWLDALTPPLQRHLDRLAQNVEALLTAGSLPDEPRRAGAVFPGAAEEPRRARGIHAISVRQRMMMAIGIALVLALIAGFVWRLSDGGANDLRASASATQQAGAHETATVASRLVDAATRSAEDYIRAVGTQGAEQAVADQTAIAAVSSAPGTSAVAPGPVQPPTTSGAGSVAPPAAPAPTSPPPAATASCSGPDFDQDGLCDSIDLCRNTNSAWRPVDANGCGQREVDFDLDVVCDPGAVSTGPLNCTGTDLCRNTNSAWTPVDASGCAQREVDFDLDGVCDPDAESTGPNNCSGSDLCPNSLPGQAVKSDGC